MQCKWAITKCFTLSTPPRKFPLKAPALFTSFLKSCSGGVIFNLRKDFTFLSYFAAFAELGYNPILLLLLNCRQLSLNRTWTIHNYFCGALISLRGLNLTSQSLVWNVFNGSMTKTNWFETMTFETTFILDLFIWDHDIWDRDHLRPLSFETCSFETTFIWDFFIYDHIHLRPRSFEITLIWDFFIWDHIHLRSHWFEITSFLCHVKVQLFWFTVNQDFYDLPSTSLRETWSFVRWPFIWSFARLRPSVSRGDSRWVVKTLAL